MIGTMVLGVLGGFVVGVMWREAWELIKGRDNEVDLFNRLKVNTSALAVGLLVSMLFTGGVGVYVAVSADNYNDLVDCISDYNEQVESARDSRVDVADDLSEAEQNYLDAELDYQRGLLESVQAPVPGRGLRQVIETRIDATEEYREQLRNQESVRDAKPYPPTSLCEDAR
jgi:hypothetical protein